MNHVKVALVLVFGLLTVQLHGVHAQSAEAATRVSEWAAPSPNTPVVGPCSGTTVDYWRDNFIEVPALPPSCAAQLEANLAGR
jgi:hypothetical protein